MRCKAHQILRKYFLYICMSGVLASAVSTPVLAAPGAGEEFKTVIKEHVFDDYKWHFFSLGDHHCTLYLPIIVYKKGHGLDIFSSHHLCDENHGTQAYKGYRISADGRMEALDGSRVYSFSISKNVAAILVSVLILVLTFVGMARYYESHCNGAPHGLWMLMEMLVCLVRDKIAKPNIGMQNYQRFMPYLLTVFFYVLLNNTMGLLPGGANVTGHPCVAMVLAALTFIVTHVNARWHYWYHLFSPPGVPKWLLPIVVLTEVIGVCMRPFVLMFRLFANIASGHVMMFSIISVIFLTKSIFAALVSVPLGVFVFILKLGIGFLQAYFFTMLSALYIGGAVGDNTEIKRTING